MSIYGIGANYEEEDVSGKFITANVVGVGHTAPDAPELHQFIKSLKVGDIVYLKSTWLKNPITVKAIGVLTDDKLVGGKSHKLVSAGRNIKWLVTQSFEIPRPKEKNNVRLNTMYEEFHPEVQKAILDKL